MLNHGLITAANFWKDTPDEWRLLQQVNQVNFLSYAQMFSLTYQALSRTEGSVGIMSSLGGNYTFMYYLLEWLIKLVP